MEESYLLIKNFVSEKVINTYLKNSEKYVESDSIVGKTVQLKKKRRKDIFFNDNDCALMDKIIFEENNLLIKDSFGLDLKYRERYKIGNYRGKDRGFYNPHTDTQEGYSHRKISMVLCLSKKENYSGGEFNFLKFKKSFNFDKGDAIFFDSNLKHGVSPVTKGLRQVLISFFWDEDSEKKRDTIFLVSKYTPNLQNCELGENKNKEKKKRKKIFKQIYGIIKKIF